MPLNSTDFNQILNIGPSGHVQAIQNVIKNTSPSQEHPASSKPPAKSSIFESVLDRAGKSGGTLEPGSKKIFQNDRNFLEKPNFLNILKIFLVNFGKIHTF